MYQSLGPIQCSFRDTIALFWYIEFLSKAITQKHREIRIKKVEKEKKDKRSEMMSYVGIIGNHFRYFGMKCECFYFYLKLR